MFALILGTKNAVCIKAFRFDCGFPSFVAVHNVRCRGLLFLASTSQPYRTGFSSGPTKRGLGTLIVTAQGEFARAKQQFLVPSLISAARYRVISSCKTWSRTTLCYTHQPADPAYSPSIGIKTAIPYRRLTTRHEMPLSPTSFSNVPCRRLDVEAVRSFTQRHALIPIRPIQRAN